MSNVRKRKNQWAVGCFLCSVMLLNSLPVAKASAAVLENDGHVPLEFAGYTQEAIGKPEAVLETREDILNAINYRLTQMRERFVLYIRDYDAALLPDRLNQMERYFVAQLAFSEVRSAGEGVSAVACTVVYHDAGLVLRQARYGVPIPVEEEKAVALADAADKLLEKLEGKNDYQIVHYLHDYLVQDRRFDMDQDEDSAYGALVKKIAHDEGCAEAMQLMLSLCGIENRVVWSKRNNAGIHLFNKVKLGGHWYNVDIARDTIAPVPNQNNLGYVRHDFLLVTDNVMKQCYQWEESRYPAAEDKNNWHRRNGLEVRGQEELEKRVTSAVQQGRTHISLWVEDYHRERYKTAFVKSIPALKDSRVLITGIDTYKDPCAVALVFEFTYRDR